MGIIVWVVIRQPRRLILRRQRFDHLVERLARQDPVQLVERQIDAMVGDAPLREIVGADPLRAVAATDLDAPVLGTRVLLRLALGVLEAGAQNLHRLRPVLVLRFLVLAGHDDAARHMGDANRTIGGVHVLSAGALGTVGVDP